MRKPVIKSKPITVETRLEVVDNGVRWANNIISDIVQETTEDRSTASKMLIAHPLINNLDNGVTLCLDCHTKIHKRPFLDEYPISLLF